MDGGLGGDLPGNCPWHLGLKYSQMHDSRIWTLKTKYSKPFKAPPFQNLQNPHRD
jgi:hypothetical protein